jgi:putative nucleotidyltransferase with HDIG domain
MLVVHNQPSDAWLHDGFFRSPSRVKLLLSIILIVVSFSACFVEDVYMRFHPPQQGRKAYITLRAGTSFDFDQAKAFGSKKNVALMQYTPLYTYLPDRVETAKRKIQNLSAKIASLKTESPDDGAGLAKYIQKEFGVTLTAETAAFLLCYEGVANLLDAIMMFGSSMLQSGVVEDPAPLKGKRSIEVLFPEPTGAVAYPVSEVMTLDNARDDLQKKIVMVFWQVDRRALDPVIQLAVSVISPTLRYDKEENDRRIEEIVRRYPSKIVSYRAMDVLTPFLEVMSDEDVMLLAASGEASAKAEGGSAPSVLFSVVFMVTAYNLLLSKTLMPWRRNGPPWTLLLTVLIVTVVLMKVLLLFTVIPVYALPIAMLPMLVMLLHPERASATLTMILGVALTSLFTGSTLRMLFFLGFAGASGILASPMVRKRSHMVIPSVAVGCVNVVVVFFSVTDWAAVARWIMDFGTAATNAPGSMWKAIPLENMGWAMAGGILAGPAALAVLPFCDLFTSTASAFKLNKYNDLDNPLMKDLLTKAPGTYQHTMMVAHLAQVASDAIGANSLLVRTGAYYHDIGKMLDPRCFVENQFDGVNVHNEIAPEQSFTLILGHVVNGMRLAREAGLPEALVDFIPQHHGTLLVEFFYDKACKAAADGGEAPREEAFRYPGPKPQSVETAILMISDAVEAASRSIREPTREKVEGLVRHIMRKRIADGQFDECNLSTREIAKITEALVEALMASLHTRVEYPWQKEPKSEESASDA